MRDDFATTSKSDATDHARLVYMPWFPGDFLAATRGWSVTAKGVYRELLDSSWDIGGLPADPRALKKLIGATPAEWRAWSQLVAVKFPIGPDGLRRNGRLEQHRAKALLISARRAVSGALGGRASARALNWNATSDKPS